MSASDVGSGHFDGAALKLCREASYVGFSLHSISLIRHAGLTRKGDASGGVVRLIQRFGSALNMNVHRYLHMMALGGVFANAREALRFRELPAPSSAEMQRLLDVIVVRVLRCLEHDALANAREHQTRPEERLRPSFRRRARFRR